jgi:site-specific recombinase XerD
MAGNLRAFALEKHRMPGADKTPLRPIFDNLEQLGHPTRWKPQTFQKRLPSHVTFNGAARDFEFGLKFLHTYNQSADTFTAYRRDLERLVQWAWFVHGASVLTLDRYALEAFVSFCMKPPAAWIGTDHRARFIDSEGQRSPNPAWRPFVSTVTKEEFRAGKEPTVKGFLFTEPARRALFTTLASFYAFLVEESVIPANPVALMGQMRKKFTRQPRSFRHQSRRITTEQWEYVIGTAEQMADDDPETHERTLFIMNGLFGMYLRISELVATVRFTPLMGSFWKDHGGRWWFRVTGKGNKDRDVTVSDAMLAALRRYRQFRQLPGLPRPDEQHVLITKQRGEGPITSTRQIRNLVQRCFDTAYARMRADGLAEEAEELKVATVHWLRHTGISEDVKIRPREHVRDDAGHASMQTTDIYIDSDEVERHRSGRNKPLKDL